jgi:hypothetical protein
MRLFVDTIALAHGASWMVILMVAVLIVNDYEPFDRHGLVVNQSYEL